MFGKCTERGAAIVALLLGDKMRDKGLIGDFIWDPAIFKKPLKIWALRPKGLCLLKCAAAQTPPLRSDMERHALGGRAMHAKQPLEIVQPCEPPFPPPFGKQVQVPCPRQLIARLHPSARIKRSGFNEI